MGSPQGVICNRVGHRVLRLSDQSSLLVLRSTAGWPLLSCAGDWGIGSDPDRAPIVKSAPDWAIVYNEATQPHPECSWCGLHGLDVRQMVILPFRPLWPGFAINTIFYAAMLWLLWIAPGKIRRFIRIRGHRCPACGYQIAPGGGIGPVCSECGAALPAAWSNNASS
jgi:hypothetical protein